MKTRSQNHLARNSKWTIALGLLLVGIGGASAERRLSPSQDLPVSGPAQPITYVKAIYAPTTFDPADATDVASISVINLIYSGLLEFSPDLTIRGDLAESWRTSSDGRAISFFLRSGAKFHDGTPVTSANVIASLSRLMAPGSKLFSYYESIEGAEAFHAGRAHIVTGLVLISDREIVIKLRYAFPPFLSILAGATAKVLPVTQPLAPPSALWQHPVGSGPFRIQRISPASITLKRFDDYYGNKPKITTLILDHSPQPVALEKAKRGDVDDLVSWAATAADEDVFRYGQHVTAPVAETWIVGLNARQSPFQDIRVRRAFKLDFPGDEFRRRFYPDMERATGYVPPLLPGHLSQFEAATLREKMQKLPIRKTRRPISIAMMEGIHRAPEMKSFIRMTMAAKGWNVRVIELPWDKLMEGYSGKSLQAFMVSMNMDYPDPEFLFRNFESGNSDNFSGLRNRKIDALIAHAREIPNRIARERIYRDLSLLIAEQAVTVELLHGRGNYWLHPCVRGFVPNLLSYVYVDYRTVYLDPSCMAHLVAKGDAR